MTSFFIEAGINHFGNIKEANIILDKFLKSKFNNLTYMLKSEEFYSNQKKLGINFKLDPLFFESALKKCHKKKKKLGLSVGFVKSLGNLDNIKFDFYKLLSVGIDNRDLINILKKKNKTIYISTGFKVTNFKIKKCIKLFGKKKLQLLHTPMTYNPSEINFSKINELRKYFKLPVGYSNHNNDLNSINVLSAYKPDSIFLYCKPFKKNFRIYPDNHHAFYFEELKKIKTDYDKYLLMSKKSKIKKIKIFSKFKF